MFQEISELKYVKFVKRDAIEKEALLSKPKFSDMSLIPLLYDEFRRIVADDKSQSKQSGIARRRLGRDAALRPLAPSLVHLRSFFVSQMNLMTCMLASSQAKRKPRLTASRVSSLPSRTRALRRLRPPLR